MEPSFARLLGLLADGGVRFVVVGGVAVTLNGYVRLTEDVDVLVEAARDNLERLISSLGAWGEGFARELVPEDFPEGEEGAVRVVEETERCQIDIFTTMMGLRYADLMEDARTLDLGARAVRYASRRSLIRLKSGSLREKDRIDAIALERLLARDGA